MRLRPEVAPLILLALGYLLWLPSAGGAVFPDRTDGGVSLGQTRVIFLSTDKAQILTVNNTDSRAYLIQSRVQMAPDNTSPAPFIVTPPLFTLQPGKHQLLRILLDQGDELPADHESVFYLSVLAIPANEEKTTSQVQVSMGIRFVIKLFYRPAGLKDPSEPTTCRLRFVPVPEGVRVENPTLYFQTLGQLSFNQASVNLDRQPAMLAPLSAQTYPAPSGRIEARWRIITDYGGLSTPCEQIVLSK